MRAKCSIHYITYWHHFGFCRCCFFTSDSILLKSNQHPVECLIQNDISTQKQHIGWVFSVCPKTFWRTAANQERWICPGFHVNVFHFNWWSATPPVQNRFCVAKQGCCFEKAKIRCADITPTIVHPLNAKVLHDYYRNFKAQPHSNTHHGSGSNLMLVSGRMFWPLPHYCCLWRSGDRKVYCTSSWPIVN